MKKLIGLICFIHLSLCLFASSGDDCTTPILINSRNNGTAFTQSNSYTWFSFVATGTTYKIKTSKEPLTNGYIDNMIIFNGDCSALDSIGFANDSADHDSLVIYLNTLQSGHTYIVQTHRASGAGGSTSAQFRLNIDPVVLSGCNWNTPTTMMVIPGNSMTFYNGGTAGVFAQAYYSLKATATTNNLTLNNFVIGWVNYFNIPVNATTNYNGVAGPTTLLQGTTSFTFHGNVPANTPPGAQLCMKLEIFAIDGSLVCDKNICFVACGNKPSGGADQTICSGDCVTLQGANATNFEWYNGTQLIGTGMSVNVCPQTTTTYTAHPLSGSTCGYDDDFVTVNVVPAPPATFTIANNQQCENSVFTFTNTTPNAGQYNYTWNFGDGSATTTTTSPTHTYTSPGAYTVTLTAVNPNVPTCITTVTHTAQVTPALCTSEGGIGDNVYNCGCCSYSHSYTLDSYTISTQAQLNSFLSTLAAYNNNISIRNNLVISSNMSVNLSGVNIEFGPWGKLLIETGSQLTVDACVLRGLNTCGTMWQGVEIWGNNAKNQVQINSATGRTFQGRFALVNGSEIRDAHNGITVGKILHGLVFDQAYSGGIIDAAPGTKIINCGWSIKIFPYAYTMLTSRFEEVEFNPVPENGLCLDPGYWSGNTLYTYYGPSNPYNPNYAYHNNYSIAVSRGRTTSHALIFNISNIRFWGSTFNNAEQGILTWNTRFYIRPRIINSTPQNLFSNLGNGIISQNWIYSPFINQSIQYNSFQDIKGNDVFLTGSKLSSFLKNNSSNTSTNQPDKLCGVYYSGCGGFSAIDNNFGLSVYGIRSWNATNAGGYIGYSTVGNTFQDCKTAIQAATNPNVQIRCNNFKPSILSGQYLTNWQVSGVLPTQGNVPVLSEYDPAGNEFYEPTQKQITSTTATSFTYIRHSMSSNSTQSVTPVPIGNVSVAPVPYPKTVNSCAAPCSGCSIAQLQANVTTFTSQLTAMNDNIAALLESIDGYGNTGDLLSAISTMSNDDLKPLLLSSSPLSDEVLTALLGRNDGDQFGPEDLRDVLERNMPVSDEVLESLTPVIGNLPQTIADYLSGLQSGNPSYTTFTQLKRYKSSLINQRQLMFNELLAAYVEAEQTEDAVSLLENENTFESKSSLIGMYYSNGSLTEAQNLLNGLKPKSDDEVAFVDLYTVLIDLAEQNKTIAELDAAQELIIRGIASGEVNSQPVRSAQAILNLLYGEPLPEDEIPGTPGPFTGLGNEIKSKTQGTADIQLINTPNPSDRFSMISCNVPIGRHKATLDVYDYTGKQVYTQAVVPGENTIRLNTAVFPDGLYIYTLNINGSAVASKKVLISHSGINKD